MCKLCVFAGTTEGRELVEFLCTQAVSVTACVATEYGETLLSPRENLTISAQRLTREEMEALFSRENYDMVIDATHPYASVVTENIAAACEKAGVRYQRLLRSGCKAGEDAVFVPDIPAAVDYLNRTEGPILLTTGSKELAKYTGLYDFANRVYARVLPMEDSLRLCQSAGLKPAHILAMQGPFSVDMNVAMLKSLGAKYLVTKDSGTTGGFDEKVTAARAANATLIVIGRPPQREGLTLPETIQLLCREFDLKRKPWVTIVGIGPGSREAMTLEVRRAMEDADCLIGAKRMLEAGLRPNQTVFDAVSPAKIAEYINNHPEFHQFTVAMSGDVGFFSGTKKLLPLLSGCEVRVLPGLSSLVYLCARLGTSYEDVRPVSLHGRDHDIVPDIRKYRRVFTLVGGENGMGLLCKQLTEAGLGGVKVSVGENLSYPQERISVGTAAELAEKEFSSLSVALIENDAADPVVTHGLPDEAFQRTESVPMTKSEVRSVCLSKLALSEHAICWDVGAGSGSVAIEMALQANSGQVFAIERKDTAVELLRENTRRFGLENLSVVPGLAPEACLCLPAPTHVFVGGSAGNMRQILDEILAKNPNARIVATAVTLESIGELTQCIKDIPFTYTEVVSMSVARDRKAGPYHLMMGQNPIFIFTMQGGTN